MRDPGFRGVLIVFIASRLALEVVGWVAGQRVPGGRPPQPFPDPDAPGFLDMWIRWDSQWFLEIARRGYWEREGLPVPQAFFPLYPLLMRWLAPIFGGEAYLAGLFISNAAFLLGLWAFHRLVAERWGHEAAGRAATYLVLFPTSFYFSALYTEGLFFGFAAAAFYFAFNERWPAAGLAGMGAALTRNGGVFLFVPLAWEYMSRRGFSLRRIDRRAAWLGLIPAGLGLYMLYLANATGNPFAFVEAEHRWGRAVHAPWVGVARAAANVIQPPPPAPVRPGRYIGAYRPWYRRLYSALDLAAVSLFAVLLAFGWRRRLPGSLLIFMAIGLLLPISAPALESMTPLPSMTRYVAVLFPGFVSLALLAERPWLDRAVLTAFPVLQGLFFLLFTTWNWIA